MHLHSNLVLSPSLVRNPETVSRGLAASRLGARVAGPLVPNPMVVGGDGGLVVVSRDSHATYRAARLMDSARRRRHIDDGQKLTITTRVRGAWCVVLARARPF